MDNSQSSDPWGQNQPTSDGTWQAPPQPTYQQPTYQQPAAPYEPTYVPPTTPSYEPPAPYGQPSTPYQQPQQPGFGGAPLPAGYQQSPWGTMPVQPKKKRTGLIITLSIVGAIVLACVGFGIIGLVANNKNDKGTASGGKSPKPPVVVSIALGDGVALKGYLAKPPTGAKSYPIDNSTGGIQTLAQFVKNSFPDSPEEKGFLTQRDFKVAVENNWTGKDAITVDTQLIQFGAVDGATSHVLGQHGAIVDDPTVDDNYAIPSLDHGYGYETKTLDKYGNHRVIMMCQVGNIVIEMFIFTPGQIDRAGELAIMQRQVTALTP
jgi:hypothetical protein